jgi:hypothetical protein
MSEKVLREDILGLKQGLAYFNKRRDQWRLEIAQSEANNEALKECSLQAGRERDSWQSLAFQMAMWLYEGLPDVNTGGDLVELAEIANMRLHKLAKDSNVDFVRVKELRKTIDRKDLRNEELERRIGDLKDTETDMAGVNELSDKIERVHQEELALKDREIKQLARREDELTDLLEGRSETLATRESELTSYKADFKKMSKTIRELRERTECVVESVADPIDVDEHMEIHLVLDGPPGPQPGHFIEVQDEDGRSIKVGHWVEKEHGYWHLVIPGGKKLITRTADRILKIARPHCSKNAYLTIQEQVYKDLSNIPF